MLQSADHRHSPTVTYHLHEIITFQADWANGVKVKAESRNHCRIDSIKPAGANRVESHISALVPETNL